MDYLNIDSLRDDIIELLTKTRDEYGEPEYQEALAERFSDDYIEEEAWETAITINDDMRVYLHYPCHRIGGNFNNIDYDYPRECGGKTEDMIARLDKGGDDEQTTSPERQETNSARKSSLTSQREATKV